MCSVTVEQFGWPAVVGAFVEIPAIQVVGLDNPQVMYNPTLQFYDSTSASGIGVWGACVCVQYILIVLMEKLAD